MKIIITCGSKKCITPTVASRMYIGSHFKNCLKWARSKTIDENIFILSAKYGILKLDEKIMPYDLRMGDKGCVTKEHVFNQANNLNLLDHEIISTAGSDYQKVLGFFKNIKFPFNGLSMGYMAQAMKKDLCKN